MIAALPMYDAPWAQAANDRLWHRIRAVLGRGPSALTRGRDVWSIWQDPDLLMAQTCGLPFRARLHRRVELVATPDHGLPRCAQGMYCSALIRRRGDARGLADLAPGVMAYNEGGSQSGWAAPVAHLTGHGLRPGGLYQTGAHLASMQAVADGQADFAAVDAVTWAMAQDGMPQLTDRLDAFDHTAPTPALPWITARGRDPVALRAALVEGIAGLSADDRNTLKLQGVAQIPASAYLAMPIPDMPMADGLAHLG